MTDLIEQRILGAINKLLTGRVNEILRDIPLVVPFIEFGGYGCGYGMTPAVSLSSCERTEKERILRIDAYTVSITLAMPESFESEEQCYAYSAAVCLAVKENPTLCGVVDRATVTGTQYTPPKKQGCGDSWCDALTLRITVEREA